MQSPASLVAAGIVIAGSTASFGDTRSEPILLFDHGIKEMIAGELDPAYRSFEDSSARWPDDAGRVSIATARGSAMSKAQLAAIDGALVAISPERAVTVPSNYRGGPIVGPPPNAPVRDPGKRRRRIGYAVAITGGVLMVVGASYGLGALSKYHDARDVCGGSIDNCAPQRLPEAQGIVNHARDAANKASVMVGIGAAAVVTGSVLVLTAPSPDRRIVIAPVGTPDSAGLVVSGRF